jgi:hypothetical protein
MAPEAMLRCPLKTFRNDRFRLLDAEDDARRVAEEVLMGVDAIGQLREAVVRLDGPDCEVMVDGDVEAATNERCQSARSAGRRAGVIGKGRIEAVYHADQTLGEWGIPAKVMGEVREPGTRRDENQR